YLWLGLNCAYGTPTKEAIETWSAALASSRDVPLIEMKRATCGNLESAALERMLQADGRFIELHYYLGIRATLSGKLNEAFDNMQRAYSWRPRWPTVTNALANLSFSAEEFDQALDFFNRTLEMRPDDPDALLGKLRALTYLGRYNEALTAADHLLGLERWYLGDARYWRAFNHMQLGRNHEAWLDIEQAATLLINADVPKLAGMI